MCFDKFTQLTQTANSDSALVLFIAARVLNHYSNFDNKFYFQMIKFQFYCKESSEGRFSPILVNAGKHHRNRRFKINHSIFDAPFIDSISLSTIVQLISLLCEHLTFELEFR